MISVAEMLSQLRLELKNLDELIRLIEAINPQAKQSDRKSNNKKRQCAP